VNENERKLWLDALSDIAVLKLEVAALQELVIALAVALTEKPGKPLAEIVPVMEVIRVATRWRKSPDTAEGMSYVIDNLRALSETRPLQALFLNALQYQAAGDAQREPLLTWLAQATPDEIADEIQQLLRQLLSGARKDGDGGETLDDGGQS
jgi:hypothetical protein